jgi:hypothetical protein
MFAYLDTFFTLVYYLQSRIGPCLGGATTHSITTLSKLGLFAALSINDTLHNGIESYYAECRYAEFHLLLCASLGTFTLAHMSGAPETKEKSLKRP